jgi:hypothetical protein
VAKKAKDQEAPVEAAAESTVAVPMTLEERADRADIMADLYAELEKLQAEQKAAAFGFRNSIEAVKKRLSEHTHQVRLGYEQRHQLRLDLAPEDAKTALRAGAARICTCESPALAAIDCPMHGTTSKRAPAPAES